jgi:hypothetical protein
MWLGASRPELPESLYGIYELEAGLKRPLAIASFYRAWGDGAEHEFPMQVLRSLHKGGYLPLITWEPWLNDFNRWKGKVPAGSLGIIARGEVDDYLRAWARDAVRYGEPLLLRPGHEPTNPRYGWASAYGNSPEEYRVFWAHVRSVFTAEGARNVLFVWTPFGLQDEAWFPGAQLVDWVGIDVFNYGGLSQQGTWLDFYTITKLFYDSYRNLGPPLMITEAATSSVGGNKADWIRDMFLSLEHNNFPKIRGLVLFDQPSGQTDEGLPIDWSLNETAGTVQSLGARPELFDHFTNQQGYSL